MNSAEIANLAVRALIDEAHTTPKPGLVDERNRGSHRDLSIPLFEKSAYILKDYFRICAETGASDAPADGVFPMLKAAGIQAEQIMLKATGGINTHKGALFSLGLLCAAAGRYPNASAETLCLSAGSFCKEQINRYLESLTTETARTYGEKFYLKYHVRGIRGEAADGFPSLRSMPLPDRREGSLYLLRLLIQIDDTTLIRRGGYRCALEIREQVRRLLDTDPDEQAVIALDDQFIRENLTCGGCADLLACAYFLKDIEGDHHEQP